LRVEAEGFILLLAKSLQGIHGAPSRLPKIIAHSVRRSSGATRLLSLGAASRMISEPSDLLLAYDWPYAEPFLARLAEGRRVVVDYVNDPGDLRALTQSREGMSVEAAERMVGALAAFTSRQW
jgi:hypothetical protein